MKPHAINQLELMIRNIGIAGSIIGGLSDTQVLHLKKLHLKIAKNIHVESY